MQKSFIASIFWPNFNNKTKLKAARFSATSTKTTEKLQHRQSPGLYRSSFAKSQPSMVDWLKGIKKFDQKFFYPERVWNCEKIGQITFVKDQGSISRIFLGQFVFVFLVVQMFNLKWTQLYVSLVWAMSSYIANCGSLPVCAWRYGTLLTLKCKTSPDRASVILLIKEETLKSNFVLECELMAMNGNVMQKGFFIWHRKGYEFIQMSKNFFPNVDSIAPHYLKWLSWQIVKPYLVSFPTLEWKQC